MDLEAGTISITKRADAHRDIGQPKTRGSRRTVVIGADLVETLRHHGETQGRYGRVFKNSAGGMLDHSDFQKWLKSLSGGRFTIHSLRHFRASRLLSTGSDLTFTADQLGHATPATTLSLYSHWIENTDRARANVAAAELV